LSFIGSLKDNSASVTAGFVLYRLHQRQFSFNNYLVVFYRLLKRQFGFNNCLVCLL
jgi:hypothetical protein